VITRTFAFVCTAAITAITLVAGQAMSDVDTTKPTLRAPLSASPVLGSQLGDEFQQDPNTLLVRTELVATWRGEDASGICGYRTAWRNTEEFFGWSRWNDRTILARTEYGNSGDQYSPWGYDVQVRDCAGNRRTKFIAFDPYVFQEPSSPTSYQGSWGVSKCLCWSGGTTARTSEAGARVNFGDDWSQFRGIKATATFAVVMETAPDRGKAQILVDDEIVATVDTYAPTAQHRVLVWVGSVDTSHESTVSVVNLATPGRPRIDVDAFVVS
jgi:hypothetical protein